MIDLIKQILRLIDIKALWLAMYLFKATLALFMALPFYMTYNAILSTSQFSGSLARFWDMSVIIDMLFAREDALPALIMIVIVGALIYMILMQFANGGIYYLFVSGKLKKINWRDFFSECGRNFELNIKITVMMILVYIVLFIAAMFVVNIIGLAGAGLIGRAAGALTVFKLIILAMVMLSASIFSDSARSAVAAYPDKSFREILKIAADYFRPRVLRLTAVFVVTYIPFLIIWILLQWAANHIVGFGIGFFGLAVEFLLFQLISAARTGQKLWYLIAFGRYFRSIYSGRFTPEQVELDFG